MSQRLLVDYVELRPPALADPRRVAERGDSRKDVEHIPIASTLKRQGCHNA